MRILRFYMKFKKGRWRVAGEYNQQHFIAVVDPEQSFFFCNDDIALDLRKMLAAVFDGVDDIIENLALWKIADNMVIRVEKPGKRIGECNFSLTGTGALDHESLTGAVHTVLEHMR